MQLLIAASYISQFSGKNFFFNKSPDILMDALMVRLQEILNLSDEQLTVFTYYLTLIPKSFSISAPLDYSLPRPYRASTLPSSTAFSK